MTTPHPQKELTPNLFASVMGTGIIANAAAGLPYFAPQLTVFAQVVWVIAATLLCVLVVLEIVQIFARADVVKKHFNDPVMAQFFGAPPMALLTIGGGFLLVGKDLIGFDISLTAAWVLWLSGTTLGLITALMIPFLLFTRHTVGDEGAFGGWLMPVVPPMVSAAIGALLVPHLEGTEAQQVLLYSCYAMFGISFVCALIIITLIWSRLAHRGTSGSARVPTLWIILGPLGQSITAAGLLGHASVGVVAPEISSAMLAMTIVFSIPVWGFAMFWLMLALLLTYNAYRQNMPFALTWWAFTFPVGTCVTGTTQLAHSTGLFVFDYAAIMLFALLLATWALAAQGTLKGALAGHIFHPPKKSKVVVHKNHGK